MRMQAVSCLWSERYHSPRRRLLENYRTFGTEASPLNERPFVSMANFAHREIALRS